MRKRRATLRNVERALESLAELSAVAHVYGPLENKKQADRQWEQVATVLLAVKSARYYQSLLGQVRHTERYFTREG